MALISLFRNQPPALVPNQGDTDASLIGMPLAPFWRRSLAFLIDALVCAILAGVLINALLTGLLNLVYPDLARSLVVLDEHTHDEAWNQAYRTMMVEVLPLANQNRPDLFTPDMSMAIQAEDWDLVYSYLKEANYRIHINLGSSWVRSIQPSEIDLSVPRITIRHDIVFPHYPFIFDGLLVALLYFTLIQWIWKGRTVGKWICRLRIRRLDGKPLSFLDSFSRAGGYSTSLATLVLGFFEALWKPNRQALHDRIAETVVFDVRGAKVEVE